MNNRNTSLKQAALALLLISGLSNAQVYKSTDEKGTPQFSDSPSPDATEVELKPINTAQPTAPATAPMQRDETPNEETSKYSTLAISSPENDGIIPNGLVPTTVTVSLEPALAESHQLRLLLNGTEVSTGTSTSFEIPKLNRGNNSLQLQVIKDNSIVQQSDPINIFAYWPGR